MLMRNLAFVLLAVACGCGPASPVSDTERAAEPASTEQTAAAAATSTSPGESKLEIQQPRVLLTPSMGALYFTVINSGSGGDRLVRVESTAAQGAETHESLDDNGVMRMEPRPDGFPVPAGGTLELAPGGKHVMLVEPIPVKGGRIPVTLHFEHAGAIEVQAEVLGAGGAGGGGN